MNVFIREMKAHRKSLIIWCIGILVMVAGGMSKFSAAAASGQSMNELMAQMPRGIQAVLGTGTFDLSKASGFYGVLFLYLAVMATVHAAMLGATIISKEERDKTVEFLLVKPASRTRIITAKLLAALANILIFNLVTLLSSIIALGEYSKGESVNQDIAVLMLAMFILQITYLLIGTGIAAVTKRPKTAASASTGVLLFTFILSMLIDMNGKLENLKYLTPFKYYDAKGLMSGGGFQPIFLTLSLLTAALLLTITYVIYSKRDMTI